MTLNCKLSSMNLTNETLLFVCFLIMYDFVCSLVLSSFCFFCIVFCCTHVRMSYVLNSYRGTYFLASVPHPIVIMAGMTVVPFWVTICKTVCPMLSHRCSVCLSATLVYCGQTVGWIKIKLGTEVGLGPSHIMCYSHPPPNFWAHLLWPTAGWIKVPLDREVGLGPGHIVLDGDPAPPKGAQPPIFGPCLLWPNGRPSQLLLSTCLCYPMLGPCNTFWNGYVWYFSFLQELIF